MVRACDLMYCSDPSPPAPSVRRARCHRPLPARSVAALRCALRNCYRSPARAAPRREHSCRSSRNCPSASSDFSRTPGLVSFCSAYISASRICMSLLLLCQQVDRVDAHARVVVVAGCIEQQLLDLLIVQRALILLRRHGVVLDADLICAWILRDGIDAGDGASGTWQRLKWWAE